MMYSDNLKQTLYSFALGTSMAVALSAESVDAHENNFVEGSLENKVCLIEKPIVSNDYLISENHLKGEYPVPTNDSNTIPTQPKVAIVPKPLEISRDNLLVDIVKPPRTIKL